MFLILILNALFALTFIIGKAILQYIAPIFFISIRMLIAGSILLSCQYFLNKKINFKLKDLKFFIILSLFYIYVPYVFEFWSLQFISAAKTSMLFNLSPFITALLSFFLLKEKLNNQKILGLIIGFLGFIPILLSQSQKEAAFSELLFISLPEFLLIIAVASSAYAWILIQKVLKNKNYSLIEINGISMLLGGACSLITSLLMENKFFYINNNFFHFALLFCLILIIGNFICYNLYGFLLKRYSATFLSFSGFSVPLFTAIFQWFLLKESVSYLFYLSFIIVFIGLYIFHKQELKKIIEI